MDMTTLSSLAIVGVGVSLLIQAIKNKFSTIYTQWIVLGMSVLAGVVYFFLKSHTNLLVNALAILATAETVYSYFLQFFEKPTSPQ